MAVIHYTIPDDLHRAAKAAAAMEGTTLKDFIERAIAAAVDAGGGSGRAQAAEGSESPGSSRK